MHFWKSMARRYWMYIMASRSRVLSTGMTNDLRRRVIKHKSKQVPGFTRRYNVTRLVYFEEFSRARDAITREKQIKGWVRSKKVTLTESENPEWRDWAEELNPSSQ